METLRNLKHHHSEALTISSLEEKLYKWIIGDASMPWFGGVSWVLLRLIRMFWLLHFPHSNLIIGLSYLANFPQLFHSKLKTLLFSRFYTDSSSSPPTIDLFWLSVCE